MRGSQPAYILPGVVFFPSCSVAPVSTAERGFSLCCGSCLAPGPVLLSASPQHKQPPAFFYPAVTSRTAATAHNTLRHPTSCHCGPNILGVFGNCACRTLNLHFDHLSNIDSTRSSEFPADTTATITECLPKPATLWPRRWESNSRNMTPSGNSTGQGPP